MFNIKTMNTISASGIEVLEHKGCNVGADVDAPDAFLIRSADLHSYDFPRQLLAIGRAGAGTNNIPIPECTKRGIVVFNSPGANAEAVKEQVICAMVLSSRDVLGSIEWVKSIADKGDEIPTLVEKGKSNFAGPELLGKTLGVIGLGATGALVANAAVDLGMTVYGYDPFMSVSAAWMLSRSVIPTESIDDIFSGCDYISLNVPYTESTHHLLNAAAFGKMRTGVRIINESRAEVVDDQAMIAALDCGKVAKYVTDFPNKEIINIPNVIAMPHLGACTPESEDRCAVMAANELYDYLLNGNIKNSVNLPDVSLARLGVCRLCVIHHNVPKMINRILDRLGVDVNVEHMINKARGEYAYTMIDLGSTIDEATIERISSIENVLRVRVI
jgi:D-3-phosphoglycerate dehydrogenase